MKKNHERTELSLYFFYQSVQNNNKYSMYISHPLAIIRKGNEIESIY